MSAEYREKLASLGFVARSRRTQTRTSRVEREDGTTAGSQTEYWDGRLDATVSARKDPADAEG